MQDFRIRDYEVASHAAQRLWNIPRDLCGGRLTMAAPSLNVRAVESVLESLRREPRAASRATRGQRSRPRSDSCSPSAEPGSRPGPSPEATYRIDDLARASNVTVRNIRAYQERGLLHPPRREGRVAIFDDSHLSRLKIITSMLERGYTSVHITEMLGRLGERPRPGRRARAGEGPGAAAGLETPPATMTLAEVARAAGRR